MGSRDDKALLQFAKKQGLIFLVAIGNGYSLTKEPPLETLKEISLEFSSAGKVQQWCSCRFGIRRDINSAVYALGAMTPAIVGIFYSQAAASDTLARMYGATVRALSVALSRPVMTSASARI